MNILITGTSSGLGYELAKQFTANGDNVYGISRSKSNLNIKQVQCNFEFPDLISPSLNKLVDIPSFDIVILNAGQLGEIKKCNELTTKQFKNVFNVNVISNKIILDYLINNQIQISNVIAISTGAATKAYLGWSLYCASKSAFKQLIEIYALENPKTHFISLAPGIMKTKMQDYINSIDETKISSVKKFKNMFNNMDSPGVAARKILKFLPHLNTFKSGTYYDLRNK